MYDYNGRVYATPYGRMSVDWCNPDNPHNRTPQEAPYAFSGHYLWREFERGGPDLPSGVYSDRMREWDADAYARATKGLRLSWQTLDQATAKKIIEVYYEGKYDCVGYATECNVSNGYPLGIFFIQERTKEPTDGE